VAARTATAVIAVPPAYLAIGACGGGAPTAVDCFSSPPGEAATYANADVAFAWDASLQSSLQDVATRTATSAGRTTSTEMI
jgi:hypothetical protein